MLTVGELREAIEELDDDVEVRLAEQPRWAFEHSVTDAHVVESPKGETVVYLSEGTQIGYLPGHVAEAIGWGG